jgi:hypothetical protein
MLAALLHRDVDLNQTFDAVWIFMEFSTHQTPRCGCGGASDHVLRSSERFAFGRLMFTGIG